ncbi:lysylphosphatidylglycerol synthase domain-containing protein [Brevibacterium gallinarum]|uniref:Flippase-like domain-containing protein n=1 Tax=Brevibacterium gallinarum TaxID=2762220 RepID=A0ABR8WU73_9MICO|nr:lysylphosphatidylglycerol synthase domain-containing protein [Brevibacterium gallinarum]MBD8020626.1 flippase-like domain-containing protein [Brevibacterium gallinarum]
MTQVPDTSAAAHETRQTAPRRARSWARPWMRVLAVVASVVLLVITARLIGTQALAAGFTALGPVSILAALGLGAISTGAQAMRWHLLAGSRGIELGYRRALADCYASSLANMVLPGGLAGDAVRAAVYRDRGSRRWLSPLIAIGAERLSATTLLFAAAAAILFQHSASAFAAGAAAAAVSLACLIAAFVCMRGMPVRRQLIVWATSAASVAALVALFLVAMRALGGGIEPIVAIIGLAAMSLPVGVGGWGARELSVGLLAGPLALQAEAAVSAATAYGLLATVSTLPGLAVLLWHWLRRPR